MCIVLFQLAFLCLSLSVPSALANLNSSVISSWDRPRAALIRHDIYLEGGVLKTARIVGNEWLVETATEYKEASLFKLSLNKSFDVHGGKPALFEAIDFTVPPSPWADGYMFADYDEFYVYGGMSKNNDLSNYRIVSNVLYDPPPTLEGDEAYLKPTDRRETRPASFQYKISDGAGASVPSEQLGYYFGGTRNETNDSLQNIVMPTKKAGLIQSDTLLTVNTSSQGNAFWTLLGLPDPGAPTQIRTRSEGGLVWIPAGDQGMLVAFGGAVNYTSQFSSSYKRANPEEGNNFTQEISIFDIANNRWYTQNVQDDAGYPLRLVQFCAVAVTNFDGRNTHHDIYVIGGWDGLDPDSITANVSVLSIPSFRWTQRVAVTGESAARQGHSCFSPYPDQLIIIGGTNKGKTNFDAPNAVDVLNINNLEWTGAYDPTKYSDYTPHSSILDNQVTSWPDDIDPELRANLERPYDQLNEGKIKQYWPYTPIPDAVPTPTPSANNNANDDDNDYVIPVAATLSSVGGLALIGGLLFFCLRRRRRLQRERHRQSTTTDGTTITHNQNWIVRWLGGTTVAAASSTGHPGGKDLAADNVTETDGNASPLPAAMSETTNGNHPSELDTSYFRGRPPIYGSPGPHEIDSAGVHEVHGRSSVGSSNLFFHGRDRDRDYTDRSYDVRQHPMHPPSVLSGGHGHHARSTAGGDELDSLSVSHPTEGQNSPVVTTVSPSSPSASAAASASPARPSPLTAPIASIPEQAAFRLDPDGHTGGPTAPGAQRQGRDLARAPSNRAVSPIQSDGGPRPPRPGHRRHNSSMSSGLSPLPSPGREGPDGFAGGDGDGEERGMRTI